MAAPDPRMRGFVRRLGPWVVPLAYAAIASCTSPKHVSEVPALEGPMMSGSSWWIPTNPWSSGLPCGADDDPAPDVDIDGDGFKEGFALGPATTDDRGNTTQIVCISREAHLIVNGKSVGKCPWLGGRNHVYVYYADEDCNGSVDDKQSNGHPDELGWTVLVSLDGPLPPISNVSFGEWALQGEEVVPITASNYAELTDSDGNPIDNDQDGLVDVTAYDYHGELVTKRHFEIDPSTGTITEDEDAKVEFEPTEPWRVPDDVGWYLGDVARGAQASNTLASVAPGQGSQGRNLQANVLLEPDQLPQGMVSRTSQTLTGAGVPHQIAVQVVDGLPLGLVPVRGGFVLRYVPLRSSGSIRLRIDATTRADHGWTGLPTVLLDGDPVTNAAQEVAGAVIVEVQVAAAHGGELEVQFVGGG